MNQLANEKSPYLLQHADQPVHWQPWGADAFHRARQEDKPIFLSIGYATCHWCHVMAEESFDDEDVAAILNEHFIPIKVDREEQPDVDAVYMEACRRMTGGGGWPLTILMDADGAPFYAATYLPKRGLYGRPGLIDLLEQVHDLWSTKATELAALKNRLLTVLQTPPRRKENAPAADRESLAAAVQTFAQYFDKTFGGFSAAPKFPTPHNLLFLLRYGLATDSDEALAMVRKTFNAMTAGGLYDHIGGGFARYSVDDRWLVPHFEKMLYDNALLATVAAEWHLATGDDRAAWVCHQTLDYLLRDMLTDGAFASAQDADSDGKEGAYYLWRPEEIQALLPNETADAFCERYDIDSSPNFEGASIPHLIYNPPEGAPSEAEQQAFDVLRTYRETRLPLLRDDKILLGWNALAVVALAAGAIACKEPRYATAARSVRQRLDELLRRSDGRHLLRYRDGDAKHLATADDLAYLAAADLALYRLDGDATHLARAVSVIDELETHYHDEYGAFYMTADDADELITRPRELNDSAMMSGASTMVGVYDELAALLSEKRYSEARDDLIETFLHEVDHHPLHNGYFYAGLTDLLYDPGTVIVDSPEDIWPEDVRRARRTSRSRFLLASPGNADTLASLSDFLANRPQTTSLQYSFCSNGSCSLPEKELSQLLIVKER